MTSFRILASGLVSIFFAFSVSAHAQFDPVIVFGEDIDADSSFVPGGEAEQARQSFLAALQGASTEDFEERSGSAPLTLVFEGTAGDITAELSGNGDVRSSPGFGRFATSGSRYFNVSGDGFTIEFDTPVAAFGFYGTDIGDFEGQVTLELTLESGETETLTVPNSTPSSTGLTQQQLDGALLFYGILSPDVSFTQVVFGNTAAGVDVFGFDDLTVGDVGQIVGPPPTDPPPAEGAPLPVPSLNAWGIGLMMLLFLGLAIVRFRMI